MSGKTKAQTQQKALKNLENAMLKHIHEEFLLIAHLNSQHKARLAQRAKANIDAAKHR